MNDKDVKILLHLRKNSRKPVAEISKEIGVPEATIHSRISGYERNSLIKKYTCLLDLKKLGYLVKTTIAIKLDKSQRQGFMDFILENDNINSASKINGGYDFIIETVFRDMLELHNFLEGMNEKFSINEKHVFHMIEDIKNEEFLGGKLK